MIDAIFSPSPLRQTMEETLSTGLPSLNLFLGGGWPKGALTELTSPPGGGKTRLALKTVSLLTQEKRPVAMVTLGKTMFPPALAKEGVELSHLLWLRPPTEERACWSAEQLVRSGLFSLVLLHHLPLRDKEARRLQLASEAGGIVTLLLQPISTRPAPWPLLLRCEVKHQSFQRLSLRVIRSRKFLSNHHLEVFLDEPTNSCALSSDTPQNERTS